LKKLKNNKTPGEDGLNLDLFKYAGKLFDRWFLKFLNTVWYEGTTPESWKKAIVIPIHKKGDINKQENYRGISLLNSGYKIYASIIKSKLTEHYSDKIGEEQNGFRKGKSCCDGYFPLKIIIEKHREFNSEAHLAFIDYKKAFDKVNRHKLIEILTEDNIPNQLITAIYEIYKRSLIAVRLQAETSELKTVKCGVRQGCSLSPPLLFIIYI
jgi:hypothetical protein